MAVIEHIVADTRDALQAVIKRLDRMDDRLDRMDSHIVVLDTHHRADFRWLLGVMLAGFAGMLGTIAHGFHWL